MSKVDKLREKYSVSTQTFNKFVKVDETPTKKYLEYMLKMWTQKSGSISSSTVLIEYVLKFDELLPYIPLKDIYHHEYTNFEFLVAMVEKAEEVKEEKTFVREEHCEIILENEKYLLVQPTTIRGSLKYGANTKWCTSSKSNPETFKRYDRDGILGYLIDKKESKFNSFNKIAFYVDHKVPGLSGEITMYDSMDRMIKDHDLVKNGWGEIEVLEVITVFRYFAFTQTKKHRAKQYLYKVHESINKIDFDELKNDFEKLGDKNTEIIYTVKNLFNKLENQIKNIL